MDLGGYLMTVLDLIYKREHKWWKLEIGRLLQNSGCIHTATEKLKNTAIFLRLGLPSSLTRHENALQTRGI